MHNIWNDKHISNEEVLNKIKHIYQQYLKEKDEFNLEKLSQFFNKLKKYQPALMSHH